MKKGLLAILILLSLSVAHKADASFWSWLDIFKPRAQTIQVETPKLGGETSDQRPVRTFLGLTDTPGSYVGQAGKCVAVNALTNALEFITCSSGGGGTLPQNLYTTSTPTFAGLIIDSLTGYIKGSSGAFSATTTIPYSDITGVPSFLTAAITSINSLTNASQTLATGTFGSDFNIWLYTHL